jgi:hypothetical protein
MEEEKQDWRELAIIRNATPKALREPKSEGDFLVMIDIPSSSYYHFISKDETQEEIRKICLKNAKRRMPEVLEKLGEMAELGDSNSIGMYIKFILEMAEKTKTEIQIGEEDRKDLKEIVSLLKNEKGNNQEDSPKLLQG